MKRTITSLEAYYDIDIDRVIEYYSEGLSLQEIVDTGITTNMRLRNIFAVLNLRLLKKHRAHDLQILMERLSDDKEDYTSELVDNLTSDLDLVQNELHKNSKTIQHLRDSNTLLRKHMRNEHRAEEFNGRLLEEIKTQFKEADPVESITIEAVDSTEDGTTILVLSDLHFGEVTTPDVTNGFNVFNNKVCIERLHKVIKRLCTTSWRTDKLRVYLLGDIISGIIHSGDLKSELPTMEGIVLFARELASVIQGLSKVFKEVDVIAVGGNHETYTDVQRTHQKGYSLAYILHHMVALQVEDVVNSIAYNISGYAIDDVEGEQIGLFHGDLARSYSGMADTSAYKIQNIIEALYSKKPTSLISGHTHKAKTIANQFGGMNIVNGSLSGVGEFGLVTGFDTIYPTQAIARIDTSGKWQEIVHVRVD